MSKQSFDEWVLTHPDNLDLTKYEENIMREAWQQAQKMVVPDTHIVVPKEPTEEMLRVYEEYSIAPIGSLSKRGYKAMIEAGEKK